MVGRIRPAWYGLVSAPPTQATVTAVSAQIVAENEIRFTIYIINLSAFNVSLGFGAPAVLNSGITLEPHDVYYMDEESRTKEAINAIASGASALVSIQELNIS